MSGRSSRMVATAVVAACAVLLVGCSSGSDGPAASTADEPGAPWGSACPTFEVPDGGSGLRESQADAVDFAGARVPGVTAVRLQDLTDALPRAVSAVVVESDERLVVLFEPKGVTASAAAVRQEWTDDVVRLELLAGAGQGDAICGSQPGAAVAIELEQPLGGRDVLDITAGVVLAETDR